MDLGPECVPGFPCSEAAEERQVFERGLQAFLNRARQPVDPFAPPEVDPDLLAYQESMQDLAHRQPEYAAVLAHEAANLAQLRSASQARTTRLSRSTALHGPYYIVPAPPAFLYDAARAGVPVRLRRPY